MKEFLHLLIEELEDDAIAALHALASHFKTKQDGEATPAGDSPGPGNHPPDPPPHS